MKKPKFIKEIEKSEWKERAKCWRWYIRVYWELDHKPMVELESLEIVVKELHKLEEENKNLRDYADNLDSENDNQAIEIEELKKENRNLKEKIDELEKCNLNLQERLDRKEKLNEEYRKEIKGLKSDLWECECSFWFESDEVWFWKREYKRLKKWIKDHCKGYWNLFPEDEMKRQWKKADKKRK